MIQTRAKLLGTRELAKPRNFTPAGKVESVELDKEPPFITAAKEGKQRGKLKQGMEYEKKVHIALEQKFDYLYVPGPWLKFQSRGDRKPRMCQPDGLIVDLQSLHITIIEIKLKHTALAWWQTRRLYEPVIRKLFGPGFGYSICEIVKWFDLRTAFPERYSLSPNPHRKEDGKFFVHILNS